MANTIEVKKPAVKQVIEMLGNQGYERVSPDDVVGVLEYLMGLDVEKLKDLWADESQPVIVRISCWVLASQLKAQDTGIIDKLLDRAHGKPKQVSELTGKDGNEIIIRKVVE